ncbi:MAG: ATP-binding protein, partial [Rhizonema sp. NSF051]|nr:ATP-binding protein [Rhizonema sp. NSF051]
KENYYRNELIIFVEDSTERMNIEQSLMQGANEANLLLSTLIASKQYIDQIVTSMADGLVVTTLSGKIKTINPAAQALLEYDEAELRGQPISTVIGERARDRQEARGGEEERITITDNQQPTTALIKDIETVCYTKTGKKIPIAFSCSVVQTEIENFQGYVYILRDMRERKQVELAKQEFLAMISHEVRTPITSVTGMASLLLSTELSVKQQDFVKTIETSGNALLAIINDFLDFSKIESGKLELEAQPFALQSCVNEALYMLAPQAKEKGLKLSFIDTSEVFSLIIADITRLRQILINLLSNAIKFTEAGSVEVSTIAREIDRNLDGKKSYEIQFAVKDTGIGIPRDRIERLFKAFSQVNSSMTREYGGTGLGLAICKKLSELMGGRIWVESEPGVGSTFYFTITAPIVEERLENVCKDIAIDTYIAEEHPLKILLVEDNIVNQKIVQHLLQRMGYEADLANNGLEALLALRRQSYNVVLMDVHMPEMDGLTATQRICKEWTPELRPWIVAMTASGMWGEHERCLASGMNDYLCKPIGIQQLMQVLQRCQPMMNY